MTLSWQEVSQQTPPSKLVQSTSNLITLYINKFHIVEVPENVYKQIFTLS